MSTTNRAGGLRTFNLVMSFIHAIQALVIALLATSFRLPIQVSFLQFDLTTQSLVPANRELLGVQLAWLVVAFLVMSSLAHLVIATVYQRRYVADLERGLNRARWFEYALSASTMMVAIALLVGIYEIGALLAIFALVAVMNLLGLVMEIHNQTTKQTSWVAYNVGVLAGIIPWVMIALAFWAAETYGAGNIPTFVYWIYGSIFVFFNCFAINMYLQYKKIGPWRDYLYGERAYIILSLVAKSALAWQVFAGTLRP